MKALLDTRCCLLACLLWLFAASQSAVAEDDRLIVRTPELAPAVTFDAPTQKWLDGRSSIRVAFWGRALPPMYTGYEPGGFEGVTADVLGLLQQTLGVPLEMISYANRNEALQAMAKGEVDMLALNDASADPSPQFTTSTPYLLNRRVVVRRINQTHESTVDLAGERLAYIATSDSFAGQLHAQHPKSTLVEFNEYLTAIAGLAFDQADVFITDAVTAEFLISRYYRNKIFIAGDAIKPNCADFNFAVSVAQPQLLDAINQSLASIPVASILRITSRWGLSSSFVVPRTTLNLTQEQSDWIASHPKVKVAVTNAFVPMTFFDEHNQLKGLSADLLKKIEELTGLDFEIVRSNSVREMIDELQDRKVDLIAALNIGDQSLAPEQITRPYVITPSVVVTRSTEAGIRSLDELNNLRVAVTWGNPVSGWLKEYFPKIQQVTVRNATHGIEMLADKEVDGAVTTQFNADYFITHHFQKDLHIASVIGSRSSMIVMAVAPGDEVLRGIINDALVSIAPEELKDMTDRWRNNVTPAMASPWASYKDVVIDVGIVAAILVLIFIGWNYYLRVQIQKRRKAEQDLEDQLQFSRTLIDGAPVALYVRDIHGRLVQCNQAYLDFFETSREEVLGKTLVESQVFNAEFNARYHQVYLDTLKHGQPAFNDLDVEVQGQQYRVYHWILPFHNFNGQYIGVIGGWLDITEREHLTEQLRLANETATDANRSKSVFLASMSHEIRTPVSALIGLIELLRMKGCSPAQVEESLDVAHQSAQSLLSLIGDILDLSKIEAGEMKPVPRPTHLGEMAQSIYRLFESNAQKKNLEYRLVTEVEHNGIMIDALMLNQIVSNLLSNAIKFTDQGSVQLLMRELPGESAPGHARFAIQISDSGKGLSEIQRQEIFEPFVQAEPQANRSMGTGLGLSICSSLAKLLNAQLSVDSQLGLGSRFTLTFDAELAEVAPSEAPVPVPEPQSSHKLRILVVEDHAPNRLLLCRQLEYMGHEAWPCDDGESALTQWMRAEPPFDLTITDCNMPRMDGYELSRTMREFEQQNAMRMHPIFGLTANAQSEITERCLDAGMTRCLFKPVGMETLTAIIEEVAQTSKRRALAATNTGSELDKIRLLSPEAYAPLVEQIVLTHREDGSDLQRLTLEDDRNGLIRVAHKIRGGAQLAGDAALSDACHALEQIVAGKNGSLPYDSEVKQVLACLQALEDRLLQNVAS
ncbi:transporter substrate-binding domain-containing protein [Pseudomonas sp. McL0111]|uniref:transporter substrate-binding domain-containing protein n=1 Tax=Pseudomonas sp. McL0111 TaxID=3457357 RepID=UPI00403E506E